MRTKREIPTWPSIISQELGQFGVLCQGILNPYLPRHKKYATAKAG